LTLVFAHLAGDHPILPEEELKGCLEAEEVTYSKVLGLEQVIVIEVNDLEAFRRAVERSSYTKEGGLVLTVAEYGDEGALAEGLRTLRSIGLEEVQVRVERIKGSLTPREAVGLEALLIKGSLRAGLKVNQLSTNLVKAYVSEGAVLLGLVEARRALGDVRARSPPNRPFWRSGELDVMLSRALVNMSRLRKGDLFLDPFCGTGTLAFEASLLGASKAFCFDIDPAMLKGASANASYLGLTVGVVQENSTALPLTGESFYSIATDPPYGRSTKTSERYEELMSGFLEEALRVLRPGGYLVYAGPLEARPYRLARERGFSIVARIDQFVHSALSRQIVVAKKVI